MRCLLCGVVHSGLLGCDGALNLLALVILKAGDEGAAGGDGPAGPGEHPGGAAGASASRLLLFLLFGSKLHAAALACAEDGFGIFTVDTIGTISAIRSTAIAAFYAIFGDVMDADFVIQRLTRNEPASATR